MCDTFFSRNDDGKLLFAKNSDREALEAQAISYHPGGLTEKDMLDCTYIRIPEVKHTHAHWISRPFQMWGAEMGVNEHGLVAGNEAVFTREKLKKENGGLTGMDILRLALERCTTAHEAIELSIELLERYTQNACGGYKNKGFFYSNSFLFADRKEAYVLETAGNYWAYKKLKNAFSISNALSLQTDYDASNARMLLKGKGFATRFSDRLYTLAARAGRRKTCTLHTAREQPDLMKALSTLQSHHLPTGTFSPGKANTACICMHATGFLNPSSTTGSMVAEVSAEHPPRVWLTGTPYPCISLYKPFHFQTDAPRLLAPGAEPDESMWWKGQKRYEHILPIYRKVFPKLEKERKKRQAELIDLVEQGIRPVAEIEKQALLIEEEWHEWIMQV